MKNFQKIAVGVDVGALRHGLKLVPELWDQWALRKVTSQHSETQSIILRGNPYTEGEDINSVLFGTHCENYPAFAHLPQARRLVFGLMAQVEGEELGRVIISKSAPGVNVLRHTDLIPMPLGARPIQPADYYERYHIVLQSQPGCLFECGGETVAMAMGEIWWFDNTQPHEVVNNSADDRVHLIVDVRVGHYNYVPGFGP
jgi:hypothetical protein